MTSNISHDAPTGMTVALELAAAGLYVFPCSAEKTPLVKWTEVATRDSAMIRNWWRRWPNALVGIHCGMSKITVLDGDRHGGPDGVAALTNLLGGDLVGTGCPVTLSPNNGIHVYCRASETAPLRNSNGVVAPGVDVRGDGGLIIAPGSLLPDGRGWMPMQGAPLLVDAFRGGHLPEVPDAIVRLSQQGKKAKRDDEGTFQAGNARAGDTQDSVALLNTAVEELAAAAKSTRNDTLNTMSLHMGRLVRDRLLSRDQVYDAFVDACHRNGYIPEHGLKAFVATFNSGFTKGMENSFRKTTSSGDFHNSDDVPDPTEPPQLLFRPPGEPTPFPIEALGNVLCAAAKAIIEIVQCPPSLAAQSVLAAASLAVQGHADVEFPSTRQAKPSSLFLITIGESGSRKSAVDYYALRPVREREKELQKIRDEDMKEYLKSKAAWDIQRKKLLINTKIDGEQVRQKLEDLGDEPSPPLMPMLTCGEPTFEGLTKLLADGQPSMGVFSDEGGAFIGGYSMGADNRLRTAAGFSGLWDGSPIKRVRVLDGSSTIYGKRLSLHLLVQPEAANLLLCDPVLRDQGFLSRLLVSAPVSTAGTRMQKQPSTEAFRTLEGYDAHILGLLRLPMPLALKARNDLEPRLLPLAEKALPAWRDYADSVERRLAPNQAFESIKGFASKLAEHALRLAAVLTLIENIKARSISAEMFTRATELAEYYAAEALRLFGLGQLDPELQRADCLRRWLLSHQFEHVNQRMLLQRGPNGLRDSKTMGAAIETLVKHGWLRKVTNKVEIDGHSTTRAWTVIRGLD